MIPPSDSSFKTPNLHYLKWASISSLCSEEVRVIFHFLHHFLLKTKKNGVRRGRDGWMEQNRKQERGMNFWPWGCTAARWRQLNQTPEHEKDISKCNTEMKYRAMSSPWKSLCLWTKINTGAFTHSLHPKDKNVLGGDIWTTIHSRSTCFLNPLGMEYLSVYLSVCLFDGQSVHT